MQFFVGLDMSLDETHLRVVDEGGRIVKEGRCPSEPRAIGRAIRHQGRRIEHVGLQTGGLSQWLHAGLMRESFSVAVMEARHVRAALSAMRVKTDRNDARVIARLVRLGRFERVHVKSLDAQETRALLDGRALLVERIGATQNSMRAALRDFGLEMGKVARPRWPARARKLAQDHEVLATIVEAMLKLVAPLMEESAAMDARLVAMARSDPTTRPLMTAPGVGVVVAPSFRSAIDDPARFQRTRDVGRWLGLTPRRWRSGRADTVGRVTKAGDARVRAMLFEAAAVLLGRVRRVCPLGAWGLRIARRTSMRKAIAATARRLVTVPLVMWRSGAAFRARDAAMAA